MTTPDQPAIVAFLNARYDEIEHTAVICDAQDWRYPVNGVIVDRDVDGWQGAPDAARIFSFVDPDRSDEAAHAVTHDPVSVLADVAAKRDVLAQYEGACRAADREPGNRDQQTFATALSHAVAALASPFASHADYRKEWRRP